MEYREALFSLNSGQTSLSARSSIAKEESFDGLKTTFRQTLDKKNPAF